MFTSIVRWLRQLGLALLIFVGTTYGVLVAGSLPRTVQVYVVGVESHGATETISPSLAPKSQADSIVVTRSIEGETLRFGNRNTGWGWPPYFKFDAQQQAASAASLAKRQPPTLVDLRYYGFRLGDSVLFPQMLGMKTSTPGPLPVEYWAWGVFSVHLLGALFWVYFRRIRRRTALAEEVPNAVSPET